MALRHLFVSMGAMVPLAVAGCGAATQQVQQTGPRPSAAPASGAAAPSQQPFLEALTRDGDTTTLIVSGAQAGTRCAGTVRWTQGSRSFVKASVAGSAPPTPIVFHSDLPPAGTVVTWSVDCSFSGATQHLTLTAAGPTTGSSARTAQP